MPASKAVALGLAERSKTKICGTRWQESDALARRYVFLDFRDGDPDDLDRITVTQDDDPSSAPTPDGNSTTIFTTEGIHVGSSVQELRDAYGDRVSERGFVGEGGMYWSWVLFGPDGALLFTVDSGRGGLYARVQSMSVVKGTSFETLQVLPGGC